MEPTRSDASVNGLVQNCTSTQPTIAITLVLVGLMATVQGPMQSYAAPWPVPAPAEPKPVSYNANSVNSVTEIGFFNPETGKPRIWYFKQSNSTYELFDNPGFHPTYGVELQPITRDIVQELLKHAESNDSEFKSRRFMERYRAGELPVEELDVSELSVTPRTDSVRGNTVLVLAGSESGPSWTSSIVLDELKSALRRSHVVTPISRSNLPELINQTLSSTPLHDLTRIRELARSVRVRYVVIASCIVETVEQDDRRPGSRPTAKPITNVRLQMLDTQTGDLIYSRVWPPITEPAAGVRGPQRKKVKEFAAEFVRAVNTQLNLP